MDVFRICIACLRSNLKLYDLNNGIIRMQYNTITGLQTSVYDKVPGHLCFECLALARKFVKFKKNCEQSYITLQNFHGKNEEVRDYIIQVNPKNVTSLSYTSLDRLHYKKLVHKKKHKKTKPSLYSNNSVPILHYDININHLDSIKHKQSIRRSTDNEGLLEHKHETILKNNLKSQTEIQRDRDTDNLTSNCNNDDTNDCSDGDIKDKSLIKGFESKKETGDINQYMEDSKYVDDDPAWCSDDSKSNVFTHDIVGETKMVEYEGKSVQDEEYALVVPITPKEAKAALEIYSAYVKGAYECSQCKKSFSGKVHFDRHKRMHDKHYAGRGIFHCELCDCYYKTDHQLKTHIDHKHMYKYICKVCSEVNFDRSIAKRHYVWMHLNKVNKPKNLRESRPKWLSLKGCKKSKSEKKDRRSTLKPMKRPKKLPGDYPLYSPIKPLEQYALIQERKNSKNYQESEYKCDGCYRGFRESATYNKHMEKHDPNISGRFQCDVCKLCFHTPLKIYVHMVNTHLFKYSCQQCPYVTAHRYQAICHYKWHNDFKYSCPHCNKEFKKETTKFTHIRMCHPSTCICSLCGNSFVSEAGLFNHKNRMHTPEELKFGESVVVQPGSALYCAECCMQFATEEAHATHLATSGNHVVRVVQEKQRRRNCSHANVNGSRNRRPRNCVPEKCELCDDKLTNELQVRKHYISKHPGAAIPKRYMCDVCGHTTRQYANLLKHIRTHTREKPYDCPLCDRKFCSTSNRDRHMGVHTGEKKYECQQCGRRYTQSSGVKMHIQTVHLKIPYSRARKRRRDGNPVPAVVPPPPPAPPPPCKLLMDAPTDYINAYINYSGE